MRRANVLHKLKPSRSCSWRSDQLQHRFDSVPRYRRAYCHSGREMRTLLKLPTFGIDRTLAAPVASPEESRRSLSINSSTSFGFFRSSAVWPLIDGILFSLGRRNCGSSIRFVQMYSHTSLFTSSSRYSVGLPRARWTGTSMP